MRLIKSGKLDQPSGEPSAAPEGPIAEDLRGQLSGIIDADNRAQARSNTSYPFSTQVLIWADNVSCSGTLIGSSTIVTANHCLKTESNQWLRTRSWAPGVDSQDANAYPYGSATGCYWNITPPYDGSITSDYAVWELSSLYPTCNLHPGDQTGWLGWKSGYNPSSSVTGYVYGYPRNYVPGSGSSNYTCAGGSCNWPQIWGMGSTGMDNDGDNFDHYADTAHGESGAGLYIIEGTSRYVIGNHSRANYSDWDLSFWNEARRINDSYYWAIYNYTTAKGTRANP